MENIRPILINISHYPEKGKPTIRGRILYGDFEFDFLVNNETPSPTNRQSIEDFLAGKTDKITVKSITSYGFDTELHIEKHRIISFIYDGDDIPLQPVLRLTVPYTGNESFAISLLNLLLEDKTM